MSFFQYIKDTKGELQYVAWPTRLQTIVYTILVIVISIVVALYLGLFDFIFTSALKNTLEALPQNNTPSVQIGTSTSPLTITQTPFSSSTPLTPTL